jgi:predicted lipoprotein with Yx(FWY)xxD motif
MKAFSPRLFALGVVLGAVGAAAFLAVGARALPAASPATVVALGKTKLGRVLVDGRGRTLYLFEKDRKGVSACGPACVKFWPPLVSRATPRAGKGVHKSLLGLTRRRQVTYAGHPLYTFVGDKARGQTSGEGLTDFGAEWYAVGASGRSVERFQPSSGGYGSGGW